MKKNNSKTIRAIGGIIFIAFFTFNVMFIVKKDSKTGEVSLTQLQSSAQGSGEEVVIHCPDSAYGPCNIVGDYECYDDDPEILMTGRYTKCEFGGTMQDHCDESDESDTCEVVPQEPVCC